jgi:hypothetical protein
VSSRVTATSLAPGAKTASGDWPLTWEETMKKLRLDPEALAVEPFEVEAGMEAEGTVDGNAATRRQDSCNYPATCGGTSCDTGYPVCYQCTAHLC